LIKKMVMADPYIEGLACWEYQNYLNPNSRYDTARQLNKDYRRHFFAGNHTM